LKLHPTPGSLQVALES
jgi:hypothetical protein